MSSRQYSLNFKEAEHVEQAIGEADVILVEPVVQPDYTKSREEAGEHGMTPANYKITRELLETKAKSDAILLHSLPRMDEIPPDVDITRWSRYWQEAFNGVVMRMALMAARLGRNGINHPDCRASGFLAVCILFVGGIMQTFLHGRDLIGDLDFSKEEVETVLDVALDLKRKRALNEAARLPARQGPGDAVLLQQHAHARLV